MKKWLAEANSDKSNTSNLEDEFRSISYGSNPKTLQLPQKNKNELSIVEAKSLLAVNMGLGVSSETPPQTCSTNSTSQGDNETVSLRRSSGELSLHRPSVAFIASVNSRIEVSSPCHHFTSPTVSVQLHHPASPCSSSSQNRRLMSVLPHGDNSIAIDSLGTHQTSCSTLSQFRTIATEINHLNVQESPIAQNASTSDAISLPLSAFHLPPESESMKPNCLSNISQVASPHLKISSGFSDNHFADSSSESESRPESSSGSCNSGFYGLHHPSSGSDYEISAHSPLASSSHVPDAASHAAGTVSSSLGCGHWCSACHVRVQVEVECVPSSQRSPSGTRRAGIRTLTLPKKSRPRHKIKAPNKELNCNHKKKKSPWPFRLNCRLRANKTDDQEPSLSSLNVGCTSCVCPGYRRPETESTYRSVVENVSTSNLNAPMVDLSRFNPEAYPINDVEETARLERAREMAEGVEPPPGFRSIPLLGESRNSLALPLTYNMINLQVLLENSLRLGLGGPRTNGVSYQGESLMHQIGIFASDGSCLSRTVHTQVDYIHCLVPDLLAVTNCGFYWGKMDRYEAERLLENRPEGTFLLRDSAQEEFLFSVSFRRYGRSLHARIEQWNHKFSFDSHDPGVFASDTVCGLIEHYKDPSCCMYFEPLLTNPLARTFPFPLQHLCRATICSKTTYDGINNLDLPKIFKNYLKEYHYKQRVRVRHLD